MSEDIEAINVTKKSSARKSDVWNYFKRIETNGVFLAQCLKKECSKILSTPNWTTSSLIKHLNYVHKIRDLKKLPSYRFRASGGVQKLSKEKKSHIDRLALEAIIKDGRSFNDFNKSGLKRFIQNIFPEIEKKLVELNIFHKVTTITSDNAPNMLGLFQYLSRSDIKHIPCMAHVLHLILCNGLGIWETITDNNDKISGESTNENLINFDDSISQYLKTININSDGSCNMPISNVNQSVEEEIQSGDETCENETIDDENDSNSVVTNSSELSDVGVEDVEDNFEFGIIANQYDHRENTPVSVKQQIGHVLKTDFSTQNK
ncbi:unnamed protein product [Rotaria sp. Silwood2]|nr:unnamed protein product [Rotaria sp. Silwood2]